MICVAGDAFGDDFSRGAVTGDAVCFSRHEHIRGIAALHGVVTILATYAGMLCVIKLGLRHPAVDKDRFRDKWRRVCHRFYFVAERAAVE